MAVTSRLNSVENFSVCRNPLQVAVEKQYDAVSDNFIEEITTTIRAANQVTGKIKGGLSALSAAGKAQVTALLQKVHVPSQVLIGQATLEDIHFCETTTGHITVTADLSVPTFDGLTANVTITFPQGGDELLFSGSASDSPSFSVFGKQVALTGSMDIEGVIKNTTLQELEMAGQMQIESIGLKATVVYCPVCSEEERVSVAAKVVDSKALTITTLFGLAGVSTSFLGPAESVVDGISFDDTRFGLVGGSTLVQSGVEFAGFGDANFTLIFPESGGVMASIELPDNLSGGFKNLAHYFGPLKPVADLLDNTLLKAIDGFKYTFSHGVSNSFMPDFSLPKLPDVGSSRRLLSLVQSAKSLAVTGLKAGWNAIPKGQHFNFKAGFSGIEGVFDISLPKSGYGINMTAMVSVKALDDLLVDLVFDFEETESRSSDELVFSGSASDSPSFSVFGKQVALTGSMDVEGVIKNTTLQELEMAGQMQIESIGLKATVVYCPVCSEEERVSVAAKVVDSKALTITTLFGLAGVSTSFLGPAESVVDGISFDDTRFVLAGGSTLVQSGVEFAGFGDANFTLIFPESGSDGIY